MTAVLTCTPSRTETVRIRSRGVCLPALGWALINLDVAAAEQGDDKSRVTGDCQRTVLWEPGVKLPPPTRPPIGQVA